MRNIYISQMKDVINGFYKDSQEIQKQIADAQERFTFEYAQSIIEELKQKNDQQYATAKSMVEDIFNNVKRLLSIKSFPNVEDMTSDRLLFTENTGLELTSQEVQSFIQRYQDNSTMLRLIKSYLEKNHSGFNEYAPLQQQINLPSDQVDVYKKFGQSALSLLETIYCSTDLTGLTVMIDAFADENFSAPLFEKIGDGMNLKSVKSFRVPETAKHTFDNVNL